MGLFRKKTAVRPEPSPELVAEARSHPGGWVYEIDGDMVPDPDGDMPPEAIMGAWKVDDRGNLTGDYQANDRYRPPAGNG
ncbi:hypothetical protein [Streptomyces sp. CA-111067]|uniref:hypothetical protein n=1 Tax=Streptomyces sp. CA-111067 TaxID=3240046 RepID=UPI003D97917D